MESDTTTRTRLRAAREAAGVNQHKWADEIGVSYSYLRLLETGRLSPTPRVAALLFEAFGESPEALLKPVKLAGLPTLQKPAAKRKARR
jgi:transcriptional regulator with XRE-family HTH domain